MSDVAIIGLGHVGSIMRELFPDSVVYDEPKEIGTRESVNNCSVAFICVPTPQGKEGACDTSIVEYVLTWIESKVVVLRSTVPVGFSDAAKRRYNKRIVFQPEYYGETNAHPFANPHSRSWITLGGDITDTRLVANIYRHVFTSELVVHMVDARTAELAKYMENCFLALKVTFCNQFYDLAQASDVDYDQLRETWLLDPRIGRSHTFVYQDNRGYGGSCLPKDLSSTIMQAKALGVKVPLLEAVAATNHLYQHSF